tara:strand:- start:77 stop:2446 length:2370 start_codon:yes stop_codon:yes gene_type:complete
MAEIKIIKNKPKLSSYGQYRFKDGSTGVMDENNLSISGEFNTKFLDDDLYTTNLSNPVNEDIIDRGYDLGSDGNLNLTLDIKRDTGGNQKRLKNITLKLLVMSYYDSEGDEAVEHQFLSEQNESYIGDATIWLRDNYSEPKGYSWVPGTIIDGKNILLNIGTDNLYYNNNFSSYADDLPTNVKQKFQNSNWKNIQQSEEDYIYFVVYMHADDYVTIVGVPDTWYVKDRYEVFRLKLQDVKYEEAQGNCSDISDIDGYNEDTNRSTVEGYTNCWRQTNGTYWKGKTSTYDTSLTRWKQIDQTGGTLSEPELTVKHLKIKVSHPYDIEPPLEEATGEYQDFITSPYILTNTQYNDWYNFSPYRVIDYDFLNNINYNQQNSEVIDFTVISDVETFQNEDIDLQQYYIEDDDKFKTSAPGFVQFNHSISIMDDFDLSLSDVTSTNTAFAYFVIDWNDNQEKIKSWDNVEFPQSFTELYGKQQEDNTFILRGIDGYDTNINDFNTVSQLKHFYQTSGLKTIKSVVFSYGKDNAGRIQALRWKLVTTRIFLNENRVTKEDFGELGTLGFTTIPWPQTSPMISGISKLSKYYDSVENVLFNNRFASDELLSETKVYNALVGDMEEMGDYVGDVDIEQTRFFSGARDMHNLLMLPNMGGYYCDGDPTGDHWCVADSNIGNFCGDDPDNGICAAYPPFVRYDDFDYWDAENNFYPDFDESCVGLIFISDSSNTTLKQNCLIELNMGDVENDNIVDTSGNSNVGVLIGDYAIKKQSTLVPLTRDSDMKLPETDNTDKAI